jgi:hypothetical protein
MRRGERGSKSIFVGTDDFLASQSHQCYVQADLATPSSGEKMPNGIERRASRRFTMALPLTVRSSGPSGDTERQGRTRDVSFRGLYFTVDSQYESGSALQFILTLPKEITMAGDVNILCYAQVVRVEPQPDAVGVAARIDRYEFLSAPA